MHKRSKDDGIYIRDIYLHKGLILIHPLNTGERVTAIIGERLYAAFTS